jgi:hypothetical protein
MASEKKLFILRSHAVVTELVTYILKLEMEPLKEVRISDYTADRNLAQNAVMWMFFTDIAKHNGTDKRYEYNYYKDKFLVPIYERDDKQYAAMIQTLRNLYKDGHQQDAMFLKEQIVDLTSTSRANVKQFTEFLKDIEHDAGSKQIPMRHPDDYDLAMGIKQGKAE